MKETIEGYEKYVPSFPDGTPRFYPLFGYESCKIEEALNRDDPIGLQKMFDLGWFDLTSLTLDQLTMTEYAGKRGATKCADMLKSIGFKAAA